MVAVGTAQRLAAKETGHPCPPCPRGQSLPPVGGPGHLLARTTMWPPGPATPLALAFDPKCLPRQPQLPGALSLVSSSHKSITGTRCPGAAVCLDGPALGRCSPHSTSVTLSGAFRDGPLSSRPHALCSPLPSGSWSCGGSCHRVHWAETPRRWARPRQSGAGQSPMCMRVHRPVFMCGCGAAPAAQL